MTIREHLKAQQRPYTIWMLTSGIVVALGYAGLFIPFLLPPGESLGYPPDEKPAWIFLASIGLITLGCMGGITAGIVSHLRIRCPQCKRTFQARWSRWHNCPFCTVDFETELGAGKRK